MKADVAAKAELAGYERGIADARARFDALPALREVMQPDVSPALLEAFLLHFCALGVGMTEPVDGWIRRAGQRCRELGFEELGVALERHAAHEAGHHALMIADTRALASRRELAGRSPVDPEALLARPAPEGVRRYQALHEQVIAGDTPYAQLAIELEIEGLSVSHGGPLLEHCARRCGPELLGCLSFVKDHVQLDVGHTAFNRLQLARHLSTHPKHLEPMLAAGAAALDAYGAYLTDCLQAARALVDDRG